MNEYSPGRRLRVTHIPGPSTPRKTHDHSLDEIEIELDLEILQAFTPFTMSVVCHARIHSASGSPLPAHLPSSCILKLYDRRHCTNYREDFDDGRPYSAAKEHAYQQLLLNSAHETKANYVASIGSLCEEGDEAGIEAYIEHECKEMHKAEVRAYEELQELQGVLIPDFYGSLRYRPPFLPHPSGDGGACNHLHTVEGILIEYIPSTSLGTYLRTAMLADPPPFNDIAQVCDLAIQTMNHIDDFSVLNDDVRLDNILVAPLGMLPTAPDRPSHSPSDPTPPRFRCVCIDFACTRLRYQDETDEQWRRAKQNKDEQGEIGHRAHDLLRTCAEKWKSKVGTRLSSPLPSERLWRYPPTDREHSRWYRVLSEEEQRMYEADHMNWGLYQAEDGQHGF